MCLQKIILYWLLCLCCFQAKAQKEGNVWYFGNNAGLDFNSGKPVALSDGKIQTSEGCASICDRRGKLLFYTDGQSIWTGAQKVMPKGINLNGSGTSTQSAIIVPMPSDTNKYYVFTVGYQANTKGICYNIVDLTLNNGIGDVINPNIPIYAPSCEKITAVPCEDGNGYWIITHDWGNDSYIVFKATAAGISSTKVISKLGPIISGNNITTIGYLIASPDGKKLAVANAYSKDVELMDFDNATGKISNPILLKASGSDYGVAFSGNSKMLYISNNDIGHIPTVKHIQQYDLTASDIANSMYELNTDDSTGFGALSLGPDGKIYVARLRANFLDVINDPEKKGAACNYVRGALRLWPGTTSMLGLPNALPAIYNKNQIIYTSNCNSTLMYFRRVKLSPKDSIKWDFGDPSTGAANISYLDSTSHTYSQSGRYNVRAYVYYLEHTDTLFATINVYSNLALSLGKDTAICTGDSFALNIPSYYNSQKWQDGSTSPKYQVKKAGKYWAMAWQGTCVFTDTVLVSNIPKVIRRKTLDTIICSGALIKTNYSQLNCKYLWDDGDSLPTKNITASGLYTLKVYNQCGSVIDTIAVKTEKPLKLHIANDTALCDGETLTLHAPDSIQYKWQDGSTAPGFQVTKAGTYKLTATNTCGNATDSVKVLYDHKYISRLPHENILCQADSITIDAYSATGTYHWDNNAEGSKITIRQGGTHILTFKNQCQNITDTINIKTDSFCNCFLYTPDIFTPDNNGINDTWKPSHCSHYRSYLLQIYNRWGERVFTSEDLNQGWDGQFKGKEAEEGMYLYLIKIIDIHNNNGYKSGRFYLIRD